MIYVNLLIENEMDMHVKIRQDDQTAEQDS